LQGNDGDASVVMRMAERDVLRWVNQRVSAGLVAFGIAMGGAVCTTAVQAKGPEPSSIGTIPLAELPKQGQETYAKILTVGPFPYDKDGTVFGNRERILPQERRGFYREYTVKTPFSRDRGARRIVCGGKQPTNPDACYYTSDHYASFKRIVAP
jgi:ribonuclease T1